MRSVFAFPAGARAETVALLERLSPSRRDPWTLDDVLYIDIDDERDGTLYRDWDSDALAVLDSALGSRPPWAVQIDVSGRVDGTAEVCRLLRLLLAGGGVAFDDYSDHPWTLPEIEAGTVVGGLRFFDSRTYHHQNRDPR